MNRPIVAAMARVAAWLVVAVATLAVWRGHHWTWIVAAIAVALATDARDAALRAQRAALRPWG
jgi:hypothetical protein